MKSYFARFCHIPSIVVVLTFSIPCLNLVAHAQGASVQAKGTAAFSESVYAAQDSAFSILERVIGTEQIEAPSMVDIMAMPPSSLDRWLFARYRSAFTKDKYNESLIAGFIHQDLQFCQWALESRDVNRGRIGLRVATVANIYGGLLTGDPRLGAVIHEGFLLPSAKYAATDGMTAKSAIYEGAANSFRIVGRNDRWIGVLHQLLALQVEQKDKPGADMARVHLSNAVASEAQVKVKDDIFSAIREYGEAINHLSVVSTVDLLGAKRPLPRWIEIRDGLLKRVQLAEGPVNNPNDGGQTVNNKLDNDNGNAGNGGDKGNAAPKALPLAGITFLDANGTNNATDGDTTVRIPKEKEDKEDKEKEVGPFKTPLERAIEAAQLADEATKRANHAVTASLALLLDAQDAQLAFDVAANNVDAVKAAKARGLLRGKNGGATATTKVTQAEITKLKAEALTAKRTASRASEDAVFLLKDAEKEGTKAARLALMAHSTVGESSVPKVEPQPQKPVQDEAKLPPVAIDLTAPIAAQ